MGTEAILTCAIVAALQITFHEHHLGMDFPAEDSAHGLFCGYRIGIGLAPKEVTAEHAAMAHAGFNRDRMDCYPAHADAIEFLRL
jgi:hypothetical protein